MSNNKKNKAVVKIAQVTDMIGDIKGVLNSEITKYQAIAAGERPLTSTQASILTNYLKTLIQAAKEEREAYKDFKADQISDAELKAYAVSLIKQDPKLLTKILSEDEDEQ